MKCGCPVLKVQEEILTASPASRDAIALARSGLLREVCVADGAEFIRKVIQRDEDLCLAPSVVESMVRQLPLPVVRRAVSLLGDPLVMGMRFLLERLSPRDLLGVIEAVRDDRLQPFPFTTQTSGLLALLFGLAAGAGERSGMTLHRPDTAETTLLFGASRDTVSLLADLHRVRIVRSVVLNADAGVLAWSLTNPHLDRASRAFVVSLSSPQVLIELFEDGVLDVSDLVSWAASRTVEESPSVAASVFLLDLPLDRIRPLGLAVLRFGSQPQGFLSVLPPAARGRVLGVLGAPASPLLEEAFFSLLEGWDGSLEELVVAAQLLVED